MTLPLLLIAILVLFLLRVPMAFAILGPSLVYLLVEDYTLHLGVDSSCRESTAGPCWQSRSSSWLGPSRPGRRLPTACTTPRSSCSDPFVPASRM